MTTYNVENRLLIIDDQPTIHDTFKKIFACPLPTQAEETALTHFAASNDTKKSDSNLKRLNSSTSNRSPALTFGLQHHFSGETAVESAREQAREGNYFSVAFIDIEMPGGMNGLQTAERLWEIDPNLHIVICSGQQNNCWDSAGDLLSHRDQLFVLKKPFDRLEVRQLAHSLCGKQRRHRAHQRCIDKLESEVQQRRQSEESMRRIAHRDSLTDLPNRPYLLEKLNRLVSRPAKQRNVHQAVLFLDLDNFKVINDSLGHDAGDDLLNQVAQRISDCVRCDDVTTRISIDGETVRLGGDEFVVLLEQLSHQHDALSIADRIVEKISQPFVISDRKVSVGTSLGIAFLDDTSQDAHEVLRNADAAMYRAKKSGKGRVAVFDKTMHQELIERLELESRVRDAVQNEDLVLRYQPIIDLRNGKVRGVEVLTRWPEDSEITIEPNEFIPMIEELGLMSRVGEWALERAATELKDLTESTPASCDPKFYLGFNVAGSQLNDPLFYEHLEFILERTGVCRSRIKLEVTESGGNRNEAQILQNLLNIHGSGIGIQLDDFGKGTSSLTCFQNYPVETVKIDRSFTANISTNHSHSVITQAMVDLAHDLDASIIAEGVESLTQLRLLQQWGCDAAQGFLLSEPVDKGSLIKFLENPAQAAGMALLLQDSSQAIPLGVTSVQVDTALQNS